MLPTNFGWNIDPVIQERLKIRKVYRQTDRQRAIRQLTWVFSSLGELFNIRKVQWQGSMTINGQILIRSLELLTQVS